MKSGTSRARLRVLVAGVVLFVCVVGQVAQASALDLGLARPVSKLAPGSVVAGDILGASMAASGDTLVIGAPGREAYPTTAGSVYVFVRSGASWVLQARLAASDGSTTDEFGCSVAISGDTIAVGSRSDDDRAVDAGAVYVFTRTGGVWAQQQKLTASDGLDGDRFGESLALSGDELVIGASEHAGTETLSGAAYAFRRAAGSWTQVQEFTASTTNTHDDFGCSMSMSGDTLVVGAYHGSHLGPAHGAAYAFVLTAGTWAPQATVVSPAPASEDMFGVSVALSGDTLVVGARLDDDRGENSGAAYVFVRQGTTWDLQGSLLPADGKAGDFFGTSVAVSGDAIAVGAHLAHAPLSDTGAVYVFTRSGAAWTQRNKLTAPDAWYSDELGTAVAMTGEWIFAGEPGDRARGERAGAVWTFTDTARRPTTISIRTSATSTYLRRPFILSGVINPGFYLDPCVVWVKKPGSARWSYSSARLAYRGNPDTGVADWWYRYTPLRGRGTYVFKVSFPGDAMRLGCVSPNTVTVRVR